MRLFPLEDVVVRVEDANFNTTKVRLFLRLRLIIKVTTYVFQYHKGAIISSRCASTGATFSYFNTTKVRLFLGDKSASIRTISLFQYHKGAIISQAYAPPSERSAYFNTTKVRLFPPWSPRIQAYVHNFNTTKVRLFHI